MEGMEDDLPSPRTLRAAAERLAQYTSEQPDAGPTVQGQGFADVFSEVGLHFPGSACKRALPQTVLLLLHCRAPTASSCYRETAESLPFWVFVKLAVRCSERCDRLEGGGGAACRCPRRMRAWARSLSAWCTATAGSAMRRRPRPPAGRRQVEPGTQCLPLLIACCIL